MSTEMYCPSCKVSMEFMPGNSMWHCQVCHYLERALMTNYLLKFWRMA